MLLEMAEVSMKMKEMVRIVTGSVCVYLTVAIIHACGAQSSTGGGTSGASTMGSGGSSQGGAGPTSGAQTGNSQVGAMSAGGSTGSIMNPVPEARAESGSRLKAKWRVGEDGSKEFVGWYDSKRGNDCNFTLMPDGKERCAPAPTYVLQQPGLYGYADAQCMIPLVSRNAVSCFPPAKYARGGNAAVCSNLPNQWWAVGEKFTGPTLYLPTGSGCTAGALDQYREYYMTGPEIPAAEFVAATTVIDQ